ncbi:transcriptional regulator, XRE family [Kribbella flavida DSM 17836]|uniref:Transcriptional regulator, XRE family n=1 Tax=Kribbella flavida (strain DSM 17836 / JCM 10339 / NBRC 14399) TaxID=479435 RepID=D2Q0I0_KRIFD|nr:helix-turn-helix transcriptional regulator [Kribbella flavida]ADB31972.1 transcriptional regulator, XRE family [Kribbella flavida DSM 17836]
MSRYADRARELGAFLRERRNRLTPTQAGLPDVPRRTPGLRREEVAELAGLSVGYYTRLEQGHAHHPSASVLDALARTLRLTEDESRHLNALTDPTVTSAAAEQRISRSASRLLDLFAPPTAVVVLGRTGDVLGWNRSATLLFPGRLPPPGERPGPSANNARYIFTDPSARDLFADWPEVADDAVAHLRSAAGHLVDDPTVRTLVEELTAASPDFAARWSRRDVRERVTGDKNLNHPTLGPLTIGYDVTALLDAPNQWLIVYSFPPAAADHMRHLLTDA